MLSAWRGNDIRLSTAAWSRVLGILRGAKPDAHPRRGCSPWSCRDWPQADPFQATLPALRGLAPPAAWQTPFFVAPAWWWGGFAVPFTVSRRSRSQGLRASPFDPVDCGQRPSSTFDSCAAACWCRSRAIPPDTRRRKFHRPTVGTRLGAVIGGHRIGWPVYSASSRP